MNLLRRRSLTLTGVMKLLTARKLAHGLECKSQPRGDRSSPGSIVSAPGRVANQELVP